jgi:UV DNA damage endonuclease
MLRTFRLNLSIAYCAPQRASSVLQSFRAPLFAPTMAKRKRSAVADVSAVDRAKIPHTEVPLPPNVASDAPKPTRRQFSRGGKNAPTNPNTNPDVLDGISALRASPDGHEEGNPESHLAPNMSNGTANGVATESAPPLETATAENSTVAPTANSVPATKGGRKKAGAPQVKVEPEESTSGVINGVAKKPSVISGNTEMAGDPEEDEGLEEDEGEVKEALSRPPPVNSDYLPLPWKGRLGYVCDSHTALRMLANERVRLVSTLICGMRTLLCSALEHVESQAFSSIAIR